MFSGRVAPRAFKRRGLFILKAPGATFRPGAAFLGRLGGPVMLGNEQGLPPMRPVDLLFPGRREAIRDSKCVDCKGPASDFADGVSEREYRISGLCQVCQDSVFQPESD